MTTTTDVIEAAGAVVLSVVDGRHHVLVVHRPLRSDWSLPKGKLEANEPHDVAAVREVLEETGVLCALGPFLGSRSYQVEGRPKRVLYWRATVVEHHEHTADAEVDDVQWIPADEAADRLTYPDDRELVALALTYPDTDALIVLRHAEAMKRVAWQESGDPRANDDSARPLNPTGLLQAEALADILRCYAPTSVISSDAQRCESTMAPFVAASGLTPDHRHALSEEGFRSDPDDTYATVQALVKSPGAAVWCTHRPVLPAVTRALTHMLTTPEDVNPVDLDPRLKPSAALILHLDRDRRLRAVDARPPVALEP
jgi:8-oxo-dGTP diphosphatase